MLKALACLALLIFCAAVFALLHAARVLPESGGDPLDEAEVWKRAFADRED